MTRYAPQGQPQDGSYEGGQSYDHQQPQYGSNDSSYGTYNSGEGQGYGQSYTPQQSQQYGAEAGAAQSYYGSNSQPYQQYPNQPDSSYTGQQYQGGNYPQYPPQPTYNSQQYQEGAPYQPSPPVYSGQRYPQTYPSYGQHVAPPHPTYNNPQAGNDDVSAFRTHYEQPYNASGPPPNQSMPVDGEGDRGFMGAMAGGAAGAYGGHKMNHGVLGGIGGAVAGSMLEDAYKKRNKKEKKQRRGSHSSGSSSSSDSDSDDGKKHGSHHCHESNGVMAGNFSASSREVRIEGHCLLVAECTDTSGHHQRSTLDLNDCFTNSNGRLCWAQGGNFAASAKDLRLVEGGSMLEAELGDGKGGWQRNRVRLNERITNDNDGGIGERAPIVTQLPTSVIRIGQLKANGVVNVLSSSE